MAIIEPNTEIYLIKSPIELSNDNQLNFASETAQHNYFASLPKVALTGATFQRKDGTIRWNNNMEAVLEYNYCMYKNTNYGNKWFYAFVTDVQWLSNDSCAISIKTDVWQTWQFALNFRKCFVEREHVNDDTFGLHTIPEGLEYGEYIVNSKTDMGNSFGFSDCILVAQVSDLLTEMQGWGDNIRIYGGLPNGCWFLCIYGTTNTELYQNFRNFVLSYDDANKSEAIVGMFIIPKTLLGITGTELPITFNTDYGFSVFPVSSSDAATTLGTYITSRPNAIDGYTPKNNKTLCSPYSYLMVTNNGGTDVCYAWEEFTGTPSFTERGIVNQGCDIKLTPSNYKKTDLSGGYEWSVSRQKLPTVSWNSNFYLNWVAVNGKYMEIQAGLTAANWGANFLGNMFTGNIGGMLSGTMGLAQSVAQQAQQIREAKMTPDSAKGNTNTGDLNYSVGKNCFTAYKMTIKAEYAKIVDDYFTQFGYKVNSLKVPNITGRTNWNYVKTHGCNIIGDVPQTDLDEIKGLFNRGVTIWHNPSTFLDYSQNNAIV